LQCCWHNLICTVIVCTWEKLMLQKYFLKNIFSPILSGQQRNEGRTHTYVLTWRHSASYMYAYIDLKPLSGAAEFHFYLSEAKEARSPTYITS
jgi:hypothetical protein